MGYDMIRKNFDTVQWGAKEVGIILLADYFIQKDKFIFAYGKQVAKAKADSMALIV